MTTDGISPFEGETIFLEEAIGTLLDLGMPEEELRELIDECIANWQAEQ